MQLKSVVLPAPFGPIRPTMRPASTSKETLSSATMPPKRTPTPSTRNNAPVDTGSIAPPPKESSHGAIEAPIATCVGLSDDIFGTVKKRDDRARREVQADSLHSGVPAGRRGDR